MHITKIYLTERAQKIQVKQMEYGVLQWSILGPILDIYTNGLFELKLKGDIISFADDIVMLYSDQGIKRFKMMSKI